MHLVREIFAVMTDTFHKPGFKLHARILHHLFGLARPAAEGGLPAPLWEGAGAAEAGLQLAGKGRGGGGAATAADEGAAAAAAFAVKADVVAAATAAAPSEVVEASSRERREEEGVLSPPSPPPSPVADRATAICRCCCLCIIAPFLAANSTFFVDSGVFRGQCIVQMIRNPPFKVPRPPRKREGRDP